MNTVTMLDLRRHAKEIVERAQHGERMLLLYRGTPAMVLEPYQKEKPLDDDPLFSLSASGECGESLSNEEIDEVLYG
jgi:prevent-host-death family protein